ncbi:hypothetical protein E5672_18845 [Alteromonas portus]|uniref:Acetoacetate decarboxylase n=1 Tax=Alteromonas portus TaxID=2565549 RepID=A0A4U0Z803_9ALTE|nr:acetoacetate decarboxylase family protein [Alteromonas portus]TKB00727.1 hypothetical protein E5672_18845 [Alteromonas portus]
MRKVKDRFFDVPTKSLTSSVGEVQTPIKFFDASNVHAFFLCSRKAVEKHLEGTNLKPGLSFGKYTVVTVSFYEYRNSTVGRYNEVGVALPVLKKKARAPLGGITDLFRGIENRELCYYILDLPVTTEFASEAGIELWALPKFNTGISFDLTRNRFDGVVYEPNSNNQILSLKGSLGSGLTVPPFSICLYSIADNNLYRSMIDVRGRVKLSLNSGLILKIADTENPMAMRAKSLGLDGAKAVAVTTTDKLHSLMYEIVKVGELNHS